MTLILKLDLNIVKIYLHTKNDVNVKWFKSYSLNRQTDGQTARQMDRWSNSEKISIGGDRWIHGEQGFVGEKNKRRGFNLVSSKTWKL